jgi:hypothetical protein
MDKTEKKRLKREHREKLKQAFFDSLPMSKELFNQLFDFLDEHLEVSGCRRDLQLTSDFLKNKNISAESVVSFLREHGGYCDCEVLGNVAENFRDDAIF